MQSSPRREAHFPRETGAKGTRFRGSVGIELGGKCRKVECFERGIIRSTALVIQFFVSVGYWIERVKGIEPQ